MYPTSKQLIFKLSGLFIEPNISGSLPQATGYQRRTTKRKILLLLILLVFGMIIILIVKPKHHNSPGQTLPTPPPPPPENRGLQLPRRRYLLKSNSPHLALHYQHWKPHLIETFDREVWNDSDILVPM